MAMGSKKMRRYGRYAVGVAVAAAVHAPLFLPPKPKKGGAKIDIAALVELNQVMKEVPKVIAAAEKKMREQMEPPPEKDEPAPKKPSPSAENAAQAPPRKEAQKEKGKDAESAERSRPLSQPLATPKSAVLPVRKDGGAPPPPKGSGDPKEEEWKRTNWKEAESGSAARSGGLDKPGPLPTPKPATPAPKPPSPPPPKERPAPPPPAAKPVPKPAKPPERLAQSKPAERAPSPRPAAPAAGTIPSSPGDVAMAPRAPRQNASAPAGPAPSPDVARPIVPATHGPFADRAPATAAPTSEPSDEGGSGTARNGGSAGPSRGDGVEIPTIHLRPWDSRDELISVSTYFGFQLIAYPGTVDRFVVVNLASKSFQESRDLAYLKLFSNRMIVEEGPIFDEVRHTIGLYMGVPAERWTTALLIPQKTAGYLAWKEAAVCRKTGFAVDSVEAVAAHFVRVDDAKWNLFIDELRLRGGRRIPCGERENQVAP